MKKAFDQTFRDIKRGVNKKVLKVPTVEQKILDATSNESKAPHGSLLAEIAQATRNYHDYRIIMSVIWRRTNDTGKNWRHVYKALIVLEFLVANGSERVIDDIKEHAYQISMLSDFQYVDSSGKDQGSNVRKKSQSLVVLVNDNERIQEVREKAASDRDRYDNAATDRSNRPGSGEYGGHGDRLCDDRNGNQEDDHNGNREDDRNGYGHHGDSYGRDSEGRYGRDGYRDDDDRGRSRNGHDNGYSSRSRSADRYRNNGNEEDGQSRGNGVRADDHRQDGSTKGERDDLKYSNENPGLPPGYDEAVGTGHNPSHNDRDREFSQPKAPQGSIISDASQSNKITITAPTPAVAPPPAPCPVTAPTLVSTPTSVLTPTSAVQHSYQEVDGFDEFDPRGPSSAVPVRSDPAPAASTFEMDLFGSLSESFSSNSLSIVPASQHTMTCEANGSASFDSGPTFEAASTTSLAINQPFDDPFGDGPFRALPSTDTASVQPQITAPSNTFNTNSTPNGFDIHGHAPPNATAVFGATASVQPQITALSNTFNTNSTPNGFDIHQEAPPNATAVFGATASVQPHITAPSNAFFNTNSTSNGFDIHQQTPPNATAVFGTTASVQPHISAPNNTFNTNSTTNGFDIHQEAPPNAIAVFGATASVQPQVTALSNAFNTNSTPNGINIHQQAPPNATSVFGATASVQPQITAPSNTFNTNSTPNGFDIHQQAPPNATAVFGATFNDASYISSGPSGPQQPHHEEVDILADILPRTEPFSSVNTQADSYPVSIGQSGLPNGFSQQTNQPALPAEFLSLPAPQSSFQAQPGPPFGFPPEPQHSQSSTQTGVPQHGQHLPQTGFLQQGQPSPQTGFPQQGQPSPQTGFPQQGPPRPQTGFPQQGQLLPQSGFPQQGQPSEIGFPQQGQPSQTNFRQQGPPSLQKGFPQQDQPSQTGFPQQGQPSETGFPQQGQPSETGFPQQGQPSQTGYPQQGQPSIQTGFPPLLTQTMVTSPTFQAGQPPQLGFRPQSSPVQPDIQNPSLYGDYNLQSLSARAAAGNMVPPASAAPVTQHNFLQQSSLAVPLTSSLVPQSSLPQSSNLAAPQSTHPHTTGPVVSPQPSNDKFETKSTVWADTLSRGLVNLDISGPKANPTADIGIDFEAMNRKEKRMEKQNPVTSTVTSNVAMGKAMGSGSGMGRAGASSLRAPPNLMMNPGMNMGMAGGPNPGFGMGGYNQPGGRGMGMGVPGAMGIGMNMTGNMGMGMNMPRHMGMGMNIPGNMGMGQGMNVQQPMGYPPGSTLPVGYNHMRGPSYGQHHQGGGF